MGIVTGTTYSGLKKLDLTDVEDDLRDLPPGATKGMRAEQEGMVGVVDELARSVPLLGEKAGIPPKVYQRFVHATEVIGKLRTHEADLEKALEVVRESRAKSEHDRENDISMVVDSVKSTGHRTGDRALLAAFEKTIKYNAQTAEKAAKTRRKNEEAKAAEDKKKAEESKGGAPAG